LDDFGFADLQELASDSLKLLKAFLYDERFPALFHLDVYGSIMAMFELNNLGKEEESFQLDNLGNAAWKSQPGFVFVSVCGYDCASTTGVPVFLAT
jgi:hypothetical protein